MVVNSAIRGISYYLPPGIVSNADLAKESPEWPVDKIEEKTGILERHIAAPQECSSDLAFCAAQNLLRGGICTVAEIDFVPLCTQSPDYFLPTTARLLQDLFVFHQANRFMLDHLRRKLEVPPEKFYLSLASCGNTVSSSIPIALENARREGKLREGSLLMLVGFGVGYSWGATLIEWPYLGCVIM
jgi:3-oxoacyl-[acyl-carrier-protein] synthase III